MLRVRQLRTPRSASSAPCSRRIAPALRASRRDGVAGNTASAALYSVSVTCLPNGTWLRRAGFGCGLVLAAACASAQAPATSGASAVPPEVGGYRWLDVDGNPLPFQDHAAILEALRSAKVISREKIGRGVAGAEKLVLESGSTRFHAAFRSVDVSTRPPPTGGATKPTMKYRDAAIFECAAYELSELLGVGRVPPAVVRSIGEQGGSVQIWMEGTAPEVVLVERGELQPPDRERWRQQKQIMYVFDTLIANTDRNQGNLLVDDHWNIWLIDHTRSFRRTEQLLYAKRMNTCERGLWTALRQIDEDTLALRLEPYLERAEVVSLLRRRANLVRHFEKVIKKSGEDAVLYDLRPPAPESAQ